jgi:hypothetical protein
MRNTKRAIQTSVTIDDVPMVWRLHREQNWTDDEKAVGLAIHVQVVGLVRRELYLEYPAVRKQQNGYTTAVSTIRPPIVAAKVTAHIREAIAAGWDPESRGKPFVYEVAELPS